MRIIAPRRVAWAVLAVFLQAVAVAYAEDDLAAQSARYHASLGYTVATLVVETPPLAVSAKAAGWSQADAALTGVTAASYCAAAAPLIPTGAGAILALPCLGLIGMAVERTSEAAGEARQGAPAAAALSAEPLDALLREAGEAYLRTMGVPLRTDSGCPPEGARSLRLVVLPDALEIGSTRQGDSLLHEVKLSLQVRREFPCGTVEDTYRHTVAFAVATRGQGPTPVELADWQRQFADEARAGMRAVIDESLLVWHPLWRPPASERGAFTLIALQPGSPGVKHGFAATFRPPRGFGGLSFAAAASTRPSFRWQPLEELLARDVETAAAVGAITYQFRLYDARPAGMPGTLRPGRLLLARDGLVRPELELPGSLEPCSYFFWTVRARFELDGCPRVTEWTALHNAALGQFVAPWAQRRGASFWSTGFPVDWTYPAFSTPPAEGMKKCAR